MCRPSISASNLNTALPISTGKEDSVSCYNAYLPALFLASQQQCVAPKYPPQIWRQHYHHRQGKRTASPVPMRVYLLSFLYLSNNASSLNLLLKSDHSIDREKGQRLLFQCVFTCSLSSISATMRRPSISSSNLNTALPSSTGKADSVSCSNAYFPTLFLVSHFLVSQQQCVVPQSPPQIWTMETLPSTTGKEDSVSCSNAYLPALFLVSQQQCVVTQSPPQLWTQHYHHQQGKRTASPVRMRIYLLSFLYLSNNASSLNLHLKSEHSTTIIDRERWQRLLFQCVSTCSLSCISATMSRPSISASNLNTALPSSTGEEDSVSCSNAYLPALVLVSQQQCVVPQSPPQIWIQRCYHRQGR